MWQLHQESCITPLTITASFTIAHPFYSSSSHTHSLHTSNHTRTHMHQGHTHTNRLYMYNETHTQTCRVHYLAFTYYLSLPHTNTERETHRQSPTQSHTQTQRKRYTGGVTHTHTHTQLICSTITFLLPHCITSNHHTQVAWLRYHLILRVCLFRSAQKYHKVCDENEKSKTTEKASKYGKGNGEKQKQRSPKINRRSQTSQ